MIKIAYLNWNVEYFIFSRYIQCFLHECIPVKIHGNKKSENTVIAKWKCNIFPADQKLNWASNTANWLEKMIRNLIPSLSLSTRSHKSWWIMRVSQLKVGHLVEYEFLAHCFQLTLHTEILDNTVEYSCSVWWWYYPHSQWTSSASHSSEILWKYTQL